jgi:hypothetical protein
MNPSALLPVSIALVCAVGVTGGCSIRQNRHPADPPRLARATPAATASSADPHLTTSPAPDSPQDAGAEARPPAKSGSPADQAAAVPLYKADPPSSADATQVAEAGPTEAEVSGAITQEQPAPTSTPGSLGNRALHAAPEVAMGVVLFPYRFFRNAVKEQYSGDGNTQGLIQGTGAGGSASAEEQRFANPSATPKPLKAKVEDAAYSAYDNAEKTIFFPYRLLDDAIGVIFAPF